MANLICSECGSNYFIEGEHKVRKGIVEFVYFCYICGTKETVFLDKRPQKVAKKIKVPKDGVVGQDMADLVRNNN